MSGRSSPQELRGTRVLQLTQRYPPAIGGVEYHVARLALALSRAGVNVEVSTTDMVRDRPFERRTFPPDGGPVRVRRHRAVRWLRVPHGLGIAAPGMLSDALRARATVVHAHAFGYFPTWAARFARSLKSNPLIVTPHSNEGSATSLSRLYARATARVTLQGADRVIALTPGEATRLARWGVPPERIRVIPNGLDLAEFRGVARRRPGAPDRDPVILYVGRIYPEQKGLDTLLEAFGAVARGNQSQLRLVGEDWGGLETVMRLAHRAGVENRVHAPGILSRADLLAEYADADLVVLPSHFDSFPFVLLEAMASGLPVVATRVGGIAEVAIDGTTAVLVPPSDPPALADALGRVLADPTLAARLGAAGRQRAESYSWDRVIPQYFSVLAEVMGGA